MSSHF